MIRRALLGLLLVGSLAASTIPRPAGEFVIRDPRGEHLLSEYRGKVILLAFIQTTCPHCQASIGVINGLQRDYGPRGFQALASAFNELAAQLLPGFISQFHPVFPVGYSDRPPVYNYTQLSATAPFSVPIFLFVDKKGMVRAQYTGEDPFFQAQEKNTRAMVESLLKEPAAKKEAAVKKEPATKKGPAPKH